MNRTETEVKIPVYDRKGRTVATTTIDAQDYGHLSRVRWYLSPDGYVVRHVTDENGRKVTIRLHRVVNGTPESMVTDHINGNKLDNRRGNLRSATPSQNNANSRARPRRSKYRGVYWHKHAGKWYAQISIDGQPRHLGLYETQEQAGEAYDEAARARFGRFATLNIPNDQNNST